MPAEAHALSKQPPIELASALVSAQRRIQELERGCKERRKDYEELKAENARLREIVERLPKTADGVPATPGTRLYPMYPVYDDEHPDYDDAARLEYCISDPLSGEFIREHDGLEIDTCYSTREAAEAAREAKDGD